MKKIAYFALLLAAGCSDKDNPIPVTPPTASFSCLVDGVSFSHPAKAVFVAGTTGSGNDVLGITATDEATKTTVHVIYVKARGSADSNYYLESLTYQSPTALKNCSQNLLGTALKTAAGGWSGTFRGEDLSGPAGAARARISEGLYSEVRL